MMSKRIQSSCRPDSAKTETTKLTMPSDNNFSLTTNSAFKESERNPFSDNQFSDAQPMKRTSQMRKSILKNQEERKQKEKEKEKEKIEYDKLKQKPIQKTISVKYENKKSVVNSGKPGIISQPSQQKREEPKPVINISEEPSHNIDYSKWKVNGEKPKQKKSMKK